MQNRFFTLPRDVFEELILSRLTSLSDRKAAIRMMMKTLDEAKERFDQYLTRAMSSNLLALQFVAHLERRDIAWFLQKFYARDSEQFAKLLKEVDGEHVTAADYAMYALTADVCTLDTNWLFETIHHLQDAGYADRIIRSLSIIHHYLTHQKKHYDKELKALIQHADGAYINLSGAIIENNFSECDLSYANFSGAGFYATATAANLECANFRNAVFDGRTNLCVARTRGMYVEGLTLANGFVIDSEASKERRKSKGCTIL